MCNDPDSYCTDDLRTIAIDAMENDDENTERLLDALYARMSAAELWDMLQTAQRDGIEAPNATAWGDAFWRGFLGPPLTTGENPFVETLESALVTALERDLRECRTEREHRVAITVASDYLARSSPDDLQAYLEAEAEEPGSGDDLAAAEYVTLRKLLTAARAAHLAKIGVDAEGVARRREERRVRRLPLELPPRPAEHYCPLSYDVMLDPVVAADGVSYERERIEGWFFSGRTTSPSTNIALAHTELFENVNLRKLIVEHDEVEHQKWLSVAAALAPLRTSEAPVAAVEPSDASDAEPRRSKRLRKMDA